MGPVGQGGESVDLLLGDVLGKALEAGRHVPLSDVDVVALGHPRRAAAHQSRQAEFVHPAFRAAGSERVPPAVKLERLQLAITRQFRLPDGSLVRVLHARETTASSRLPGPSSRPGGGGGLVAVPGIEPGFPG